jgi:hypothetical protein
LKGTKTLKILNQTSFVLWHILIKLMVWAQNAKNQTTNWIWKV